MGWRNDQIRDLVIRTLIGESDGSPEGMTSVAHVMKNRADSGAWGDRTINGLTRVITAPKQFSIWNPGYPHAPALRAIPPTDPRYQRAAAIADGVFSENIPDNTGGANHYYAPRGMPGGAPPDWAVGQTPTATIGGHHFYRLGLNASNTAGTAVISPSTVGQGSTAQSTPVTAAIGPPIQSFTGGDYGRQATASKQPFSGIVIHVTGKPDLQSELEYNRTPDKNRGNAYYGYHYIVDRDGKVYQTAPDDVRTNHIMGNAAKGLNNENAIGVAFVGGAPAGQNPLPMTPEQEAAGKSLVNELKTKYNIAPDKIVSHGELDTSRIKGLNPDGGAEGKDFITAYRTNPDPRPMGEGGGPTPYGIVMTADATTPAPVQQNQGQQTAPPAPAGTPGAASAPARGPSPSAGFVGPGSDKVSLVQSITSGTSHNPQITTAANWGNLFGGAAPAATPPAASAAAPTPVSTPQPASLPMPLAPPGSPLEPEPPDFSKDSLINAHPSMGFPALVNPFGDQPSEPAPVSQQPALPSSVMSNAGADVPYDPKLFQHQHFSDTSRAPLTPPATTPGAPSMGFPAMTNPFGPAAQIPGSMLSSAQQLIKSLFG